MTSKSTTTKKISKMPFLKKIPNRRYKPAGRLPPGRSRIGYPGKILLDAGIDTIRLNCLHPT